MYLVHTVPDECLLNKYILVNSKLIEVSLNILNVSERMETGCL